MSKKCEMCRHFFNDPALEFKYGVCGSEDVLGVMLGSAEAIDINSGRMICDKEGDGIFVYFEPIEQDPSAGATFPSFVQITRESHAMAAGGAA